MPLDVNLDLPTKFPDPSTLTLDSFKRGVITVVAASKLPKNAAVELNNLFLVEDGQPSIRPGVDWYGVAPTVTVTSTAMAPTASAGTNWTNPTNVYTSDDNRAVYANTAQDNLRITGFGLSIPTTATITGVTITVEGNGTDATAANRSIEVGLTKDGTTLTGTRAASQNLNQTTDTTLTFGGATSMFGTTLTPLQASATTFGVLLRAANTNAGARNIDQVTVAVTYTDNFQLDGVDYFDYGGAIHLVAAAGGYVHRSLDNGLTWTQCTTTTPQAPLTAGVDANMNQNGSYLYITTGPDNMVRYDGSTTLVANTALTTPAAPTATIAGAAGATYTYYYKISRVNTVGFSAASAKVTAQHSVPRSAWDSTTNYYTLGLPAYSTGQTRFDIYFSEDDLNYFYLDSVTTPNTTYKDNGSAVVVPSTLAPTGNTTLGPKVAELTNVGSRQYGVRDSDNRYRIWFTGTGTFSGAFSTAYDGGYLDWQPGGKFIPIHVEDYRDGKGTPLATVWCDSADGQGCILQMSLDTLTIGDISITVPSAYKLPGSRGTPAPGSVVNVLNDYYFYNQQAFYNLGSRAQFLNLLSTDEASANIRPTIKQINNSAEDKIASVYFDAKVYFSVPYGSDENNYTAIYDTERKAWMPKAFTIGFKKFLRYTDTRGTPRLLAYKPGDTKLTQIASNIQGDYGEAFQTSLLTGLYPTQKNRFEFQWSEEAEIELANPGGSINVEILGSDRKIGYRSQKSKTLSFDSDTVALSGWDTFAWDTSEWDDVTDAPEATSEPSVYKYFSLQKELSNIQWHIATNSLTARYVLRTLQTWGTDTEGGHPQRWRA